MSDSVREAFEALENLRKWADDHPAGIEDEVETWHSAVQAALSANGGEAVTPVWDNKVLVSNIVRAFWRRIYTCKDRYPAKELPREVPIELYCAMSTALMHLGNESLNPKHPAPPSVAVPEGFCLERGHRLHYARTGEVCICPKYVRHPNCDRAEMDETLPIANPWLTTAPAPDHSGEADMADDLPRMWDQSDLSGGETDARPPKHHTLKTDPSVYDRSAAGRKPWEIRLNDRDYQVGDTVTLQETVFSGAQMREGAALGFTGKELCGQITYVLRGPKYGLADGWCIFSVETDHIADAGKVVWAVIDRNNQIAFSVTPDDEYKEEWAVSLCHVHINEAVSDGIEGAANWVVRPLTIGNASPSVPENEIERAKAIGGRDALLMMAKRHLSTAETHSNITAKITCQKLAKACQQQAGRLRTAGDGGEGV